MHVHSNCLPVQQENIEGLVNGHHMHDVQCCHALNRAQHCTHEQPMSKQLLRHAAAASNWQEGMDLQWQLQWQQWAPDSGTMGNEQCGMGNE